MITRTLYRFTVLPEEHVKPVVDRIKSSYPEARIKASFQNAVLTVAVEES